MTYSDSLWKDAPESASLYALVIGPQKLVHNKLTDVWCWFKEYKSGLYHRWDEDHKCFTNACYTMRDFTETHVKPAAYTPSAQLVDQYRKEHAEQIEAVVMSDKRRWDGVFIFLIWSDE